MSDQRVFESEKRKKDNIQPKKCHTKPSAPKGKQRSNAEVLSLEEYFEGYVLKMPMTQWAVSTFK